MKKSLLVALAAISIGAVAMPASASARCGYHHHHRGGVVKVYNVYRSGCYDRCYRPTCYRSCNTCYRSCNSCGSSCGWWW
jgi:hypothetical protein